MSHPEDKRRRRRIRDPQIIREEVLRPSRYLGYDRDDMGCYFLGREAFELAESQFRRAVYLNPFEPSFKVHWAVALTHLNRLDEARALLVQLFRNRQDDAGVRRMWHHFWPGEQPPEPRTGSTGTPEADPAPTDPAAESEGHD
ncbi:MAG: hypothetical protein HRF43_15500 [Phycisphaerae bacterium]|jgi:hypothetical protein